MGLQVYPRSNTKKQVVTYGFWPAARLISSFWHMASLAEASEDTPGISHASYNAYIEGYGDCFVRPGYGAPCRSSKPSGGPWGP